VKGGIMQSKKKKEIEEENSEKEMTQHNKR
jgi:hypothetical protein